MALLTPYLNQKVQYESVTSENMYSEPIRAESITIKARRQDKRRVQVDALGNIIKSIAVYYTEYPVRAGDFLDGYLVLDVIAMVDLGGNIVGYKCVV